MQFIKLIVISVAREIIMDNSTIGLVIQIVAILGGILSFIVICSIGFGGYKARFKSVEYAVEKKLPEEINKVSNNIFSLDKKLSNISSALVQSNVLHGDLLKSASPINITSKGRNALEKSNFIKIFSEHRTEIITKIKNKKPQTEYDVEQIAVNIISNLADKPFMKPLKQFAYSEGKPLANVLYLAGIYVRNEYLKSEFKK